MQTYTYEISIKSSLNYSSNILNYYSPDKRELKGDNWERRKETRYNFYKGSLRKLHAIKTLFRQNNITGINFLYVILFQIRYLEKQPS